VEPLGVVDLRDCAGGCRDNGIRHVSPPGHLSRRQHGRGRQPCAARRRPRNAYGSKRLSAAHHHQLGRRSLGLTR
jgi:hypothetical protein